MADIVPKRRRPRRQAEKIQVYLLPAVEADKVLLDLWKACQHQDRPQDVFRHILRAGLRTLVDAGELPPELVQKLRLNERVGTPRAAMPHHGYGVPPVPQPIVVPVAMPAPAQQAPILMPAATAPQAPAADPVRIPEPVRDPVPAPAPSSPPPPPRSQAAAAEPNLDDILGLMGNQKG